MQVKAAEDFLEKRQLLTAKEHDLARREAVLLSKEKGLAAAAEAPAGRGSPVDPTSEPASTPGRVKSTVSQAASTFFLTPHHPPRMHSRVWGTCHPHARRVTMLRLVILGCCRAGTIGTTTGST